MNREQVKEIVQVALELKPGESMSIEVPSKNQGLSLRTMFYRERMRFLERGLALNVSLSSIEQRESGGQWIAVFTYEEPPKITIHKQDGSSSMVSLEPKISLIPDTEIPEDVKGILERYRTEKEGEKNDK